MRVKKLSGIVIRIAVVLLCLVLFSAHLASGMFARYSTAMSAQDDARVAKYDVTVTSADANDFTVVDNGSGAGVGTYKFILTNRSEVPAEYNIHVDLSIADSYISNYGDDIYRRLIQDIRIDDAEGVPNTDHTQYSFSGMSGLLDSGESKEYTMTLMTDLLARYSESTGTTNWNRNRWDREWIPVTFNITAEAVQVD